MRVLGGKRPLSVGGLLLALSLASGVGASANQLTSTARHLGAGSTSVPQCAESSWTLTAIGPPARTVTGIAVSNISSGCENFGDTLTVLATAGGSIATGSTNSINATTVSISFTSCSGGSACIGNGLSTTAVDRLAATITGP